QDMRTFHRLEALTPLCLSLLVVVAFQARAQAQSGELNVAAARAGQLRVDGDLGEWRGVRPKLFGDAADSSLELRLAQDGSGLFIGAAVHDDTLVRSERPSAAEDALVLE